jgi:phosphate starvation-inducible protein PhoH
MLHGYAGTGKSFIGLYLALNELQTSHIYKKVIIFRSAVATREIGHLPGSDKDKTKIYELPYYDICAKLYGRGDAYEILKSKKLVEFYSTSFIRGITLDDAIVIVDEVQNMTAEELNSLITRMGNNTKVVMCGDVRQTDLNKRKESSGLRDFYKIIQSMNAFELVEFGIDDIVRSKLVKEYIIKRTELEDRDEIRPL